jgi:hypothetical protein
MCVVVFFSAAYSTAAFGLSRAFLVHLIRSYVPLDKQLYNLFMQGKFFDFRFIGPVFNFTNKSLFISQKPFNSLIINPSS